MLLHTTGIPAYRTEGGMRLEIVGGFKRICTVVLAFPGCFLFPPSSCFAPKVHSSSKISSVLAVVHVWSLRNAGSNSFPWASNNLALGQDFRISSRLVRFPFSAGRAPPLEGPAFAL